MRETLGDMASINLLQLQILGLVAYSPSLIEDVFRVARLTGYYMVYPTTENRGLNKHYG